MVCDCAHDTGNDEVCRWLGAVAGRASNYPGVHCRTNAGRMVRMRINEFIKKVNRNDRMEAEEVDGVITIYNDSDHEVIDIPNGATNLLEINFIESYSRYNFGKPSREYLSALIEEFLHTPINERFPEKKYRLRWITDDDGTPNYIHKLCGSWNWNTNKRDTKTFTEKELQQLKINNPRFAPAIDAMKELVEEDQ